MPADSGLQEANTKLALAMQERDADQVRLLLDSSITAWANSPHSSDRQDVLQFATLAGRWALQRNDMVLFTDIAERTGRWCSTVTQAGAAEGILPVLDSWLHRIIRHDRSDAIAPLFGALQAACKGTGMPETLLQGFLPDWRVAAGQAALNPESPMARMLVESLLQFAAAYEKQDIWFLALDAVSQVGALSVQKYGVVDGFPVVLPLLEQGRILLLDELKFADGPDSDSLRQAVIRRICRQGLHVAEIAARADVTTNAGDMIVLLHQSWKSTPMMDSYEKSIKKFCQLLLLYWANNRKRTARRWEPQDAEMRVPLLFTEEEHAKLTFLIN